MKKINNERFKKWDWLLYVPIIGMFYDMVTSTAKRRQWDKDFEEAMDEMRTDNLTEVEVIEVSSKWYRYLSKSNNTQFISFMIPLVIFWIILLIVTLT